jgi:hypothetical protein
VLYIRFLIPECIVYEIPPSKVLYKRSTPLDLSAVTLNELMEDLVDLLAENTHNVWAKDRIKHGWTYGMSEV